MTYSSKGNLANGWSDAKSDSALLVNTRVVNLGSELANFTSNLEIKLLATIRVCSRERTGKLASTLMSLSVRSMLSF